ncbi:MAG: nucleoside triphosphate pyrophosphohydrolase [Novosphingobium sp. 16-62-11]|uniref:nucleoside triphosphate pyrophosphohydrolase n=1 Tax=Novosphingobium sp. 17-62-19 TaxID=1970406 RepID=UPI000BC783FD|nr:nucleoside triphosphate pyrophosphohydrolase [Novosphingobium sp. 17-62-19]OYX92866.1 MAG: nucleoside triphosphate pyrophosphohydrolase [Novosphingobium sp. 35-62-5]OYZ42466.1 MAG: nucleoside triphosphate pyrophosphohydrolase [Novosphingobium sp. 16-62-11]OZA17903.1 MAG: nucleoside triphosphate pyrophosphohydrolase [Novosphingobium sp. 17-62-19]
MAIGVTTPNLERLLGIMARLRDPQHGCEWDCAQTFSTIAPYTIEEVYEVDDAIARDDMPALKEELGDLLLQVVFHARMAEELGLFSFDHVAAAISDKMEARHPHVFGNESDEGQSREDRWESAKAAEREAKGAQSALDGVARSLPGLMRAEKLQTRAARQGFDWPDADGAAAKVFEEIDELREASSEDERMEEAGDLLFAVVNLVRKSGVAPEDALRAANAKFERRFRGMEARAQGQFAMLSLDQQEALWQEVKQSER